MSKKRCHKKIWKHNKRQQKSKTWIVCSDQPFPLPSQRHQDVAMLVLLECCIRACEMQGISSLQEYENGQFYEETPSTSALTHNIIRFHKRCINASAQAASEKKGYLAPNMLTFHSCAAGAKWKWLIFRSTIKEMNTHSSFTYMQRLRWNLFLIRRFSPTTNLTSPAAYL